MDVELWRSVTNSGSRNRAPALAARDVRMALGTSKLLEPDGAGMLVTVLRNDFAPSAANAIHWRAMQYMHFRRPDPFVGEYNAENDRFYKKAEPENGNGGWLSVTSCIEFAYGLRSFIASCEIVGREELL